MGLSFIFYSRYSCRILTFNYSMEGNFLLPFFSQNGIQRKLEFYFILSYSFLIFLPTTIFGIIAIMSGTIRSISKLFMSEDFLALNDINRISIPISKQHVICIIFWHIVLWSIRSLLRPLDFSNFIDLMHSLRELEM